MGFISLNAHYNSPKIPQSLHTRNTKLYKGECLMSVDGTSSIDQTERIIENRVKLTNHLTVQDAFTVSTGFIAQDLWYL